MSRSSPAKSSKVTPRRFANSLARCAGKPAETASIKSDWERDSNCARSSILLSEVALDIMS